MANTSLGAAKKAKNDEFYTQWADIEREMNAYLEYDPDVFREKTILLPCDDPEWSNFTKYFALHFEEYGIKKLISTSYAPMANHEAAFYEPTLFEVEAPQYVEDQSLLRGRVFTLLPEDLDGDGRIDIDDLRWEYLDGDGDFRSDEVTALRNEADTVITNPPFSLFREFLAWLRAGGVDFSVIGNTNALTYKEVFPLIRDNEMWLGATGNSEDLVFGVPPGTKVKAGDKKKAEKLGYVGDFTRLGNACWYTNIQHGRRHEPLQLMSVEDNLRFGPRKIVEDGYLRYDNYDAIEVPWVKAIPSDYDGMMAVPISFLEKYNPDQFEIVGYTAKDMGVECLKFYEDLEQSLDGGPFERNMKSARFSPMIRYDDRPDKTCYRASNVEGFLVKSYGRAIIRHKKQEC